MRRSAGELAGTIGGCEVYNTRLGESFSEPRDRKACKIGICKTEQGVLQKVSSESEKMRDRKAEWSFLRVPAKSGNQPLPERKRPPKPQHPE
jgi:hypothetical protein